MEEKKEKRLLRVELDDDVKKVSVTGMNSDEKVVMRQELSEDDLELVTGGSDVFYFESYDETTGARGAKRVCKVDELNTIKEGVGCSALLSITDEVLTSGQTSSLSSFTSLTSY
jgi:hypothetical protein